jgi:hypothetical protein
MTPGPTIYSNVECRCIHGTPVESVSPSPAGGGTSHQSRSGQQEAPPVTHLQLTPEDPPTERDEVPDDIPGDVPDMRAPGAEDDADRLHLAEAERLDRHEVDRAADEGMTGTVEPLTGPEFEDQA